MKGGFDVLFGALERLAEVVKLLHIAVEGELFEDGAVRDGVFHAAEGAEGAGVEFYGFDGLGEFKFGHGVSLRE